MTILGIAFPVQEQKMFVESITRSEAIQLKDDFINGSDVMRGVDVSVQNMSEEKRARISEMEKDQEKI